MEVQGMDDLIIVGRCRSDTSSYERTEPIEME